MELSNTGFSDLPDVPLLEIFSYLSDIKDKATFSKLDKNLYVLTQKILKDEKIRTDLMLEVSRDWRALQHVGKFQDDEKLIRHAAGIWGWDDVLSYASERLNKKLGQRSIY
jgi:hypothetical protein